MPIIASLPITHPNVLPFQAVAVAEQIGLSRTIAASRKMGKSV